METSYKIKSVELETVCGITSKFPENEKIEIAFAGKSNVGKSSLINALVTELKNRGSHALMLEVRASNAPAIALYEKLGFRQVGCRKNYYRNPKEDALILRKEWEV